LIIRDECYLKESNFENEQQSIISELKNKIEPEKNDLSKVEIEPKKIFKVSKAEISPKKIDESKVEIDPKQIFEV